MVNFLRNQPAAALLFFTLALNMVGFGIVLPLLPVLVRELGGSPLAMSGMVTGWAAAQFFMAPVWGSLSDRIGRRPVLMVGVGGMVLTFSLLAAADSVLEAVLCRVVGGLLSAATLATGQAYLADVTTPEQRAEAMASAGAAFGVGFVVGPMLGSALLALGLRTAFAAAAALSAANLLAVWWKLPEPPHRHPTEPSASPASLRALALARGQPWAVYLHVLFLMAFSAASIFSMLGLFVLDRLGLPEEMAGIPFTVQGLVSMLLQFFLVGPAARRLGDHRTLLASCGLGVAGFVVVAASRTLAAVCLGVAAAAAAFSFARPMAAAAISVRSRMPHGVVMGMQTAADALGRALGPLWAGAVYRWHPSAPFAWAAFACLAAGCMLALRPAPSPALPLPPSPPAAGS
ncbi:MAG TPA: MFS transporter [Limnochordales bacterium]